MSGSEVLRGEPMSPFGMLVTAESAGAQLAELPPGALQELVTRCRFVLLRGFAPLEGDTFPSFCRRLGTLAEFEFGTVNQLQVDPAARNYLYTDREVPISLGRSLHRRRPARDRLSL